jgi:phage gp29-like protein
MGLLLPSNTYPNATGTQGNTKMFEFQLVTPQGRSAGVDSDKIITRHRLDMLMTVLADFVALGHASHGTQSLAQNKVDMFFQAIEGWVNGIAAVVNRHLLPRVWELNALDPKLMPEYVPDLAQRIDIAGLADFVLKLAQSGMTMFPDPDLENYLRDAAGMPAIGDDAFTEEVEPNALQTPDDLAPGVQQRTPKPGQTVQPSLQQQGNQRQAATVAALNASAQRRVNRVSA